jgi:hypothetical protein
MNSSMIISKTSLIKIEFDAGENYLDNDGDAGRDIKVIRLIRIKILIKG